MPTNRKVTYLLGAGASYNALPLVKEMYPEFVEMMRYIKLYNKNIKNLGDELELSKTSFLIELLKDHYSVDTLARKFKLKGDVESYSRVKNLIASLIIFKSLKLNQNAYEMPVIGIWESKDKKRDYSRLDNRYDSFLAALLQEEELFLPKNINVISWNYDFQFELAMSFYTENNLLRTAHETNVYNENLTNSVNQDFGSIIKINGTAIMYFSQKTQVIYDNYSNEIHSLFFEALKNELSSEITNSIMFAWEHDSNIRSRKLAKEIIGQSDFVVVIGYSFPIFNREVDIALFENFNLNQGRIIIQDHPNRVNAIRNQLEAIKPGLSSELITTTQSDLDQFFIPNEYWSYYEPFGGGFVF